MYDMLNWTLKTHSYLEEEKPVCDLWKNFLSFKYILIECTFLNDVSNVFIQILIVIFFYF